MPDNDLRITFAPSQNEFAVVRTWLEVESNPGFFHHWDQLRDARENQRLACAILANETVGFLYWTEDIFIATFQVLCVRAASRGLGIGRRLVNAVCQQFRVDPVDNPTVIKLICDPPASHLFWEHLGFQRFPPYDYRHDLIRQHLYKAVDMYCPPSSSTRADHMIEFWHEFADELPALHPDTVLRFPSDSSLLRNIQPVVVPSHQFAHIRFSKMENVIWDGQLHECPAFSRSLFLWDDFLSIDVSSAFSRLLCFNSVEERVEERGRTLS
jgi:GNAT superfamily N-acetyltransferase